MPNVRIMSRSSICMVLLTAACFASQQEPVASQPDPGELVRRVVRNEIKTTSEDTDRFMFRGTKTTPKGSTTKIYIETKEATAGLVVAYNGKALTPNQRRAEEARVERFLNDPEELKKKRKQEREDEERTLRIVRAIPDAFLFEYAGEEDGVGWYRPCRGPAGKTQISANPRYQPPSRVEQILTGMQGFVLVDTARYRIASIDGALFRDVNFGGEFSDTSTEAGTFWFTSRRSETIAGKSPA